LIKKAIELDPDYAPGWVLKASIHSQQGDVGARLPLVAGPMARAAVDRALELDPDNGAAHALSGDIMVTFEHDFAGAKREFELALAAAPYDVDVTYQAGVYYLFTENIEEGLRLGRLTFERDPLFIPNLALLSYGYNVAGDYDEAEKFARRRIEISPNSFGSYSYLAHALTLRGDYEEALEVLEKEGLDGFKFAGQAIVLYLMGNEQESDEALAKLLEVQTGGWDYQVIQVRSVRGELDEAFAAMDAAYASRDTGLQLILGDHYLENLRGDPRYEAMVDKLGIRVD
jgi:Tfp pilus assembly protein PilF